ncbi:MAG TPA: metalloregulator ArsR/SmtB family transcription factor [Caulobacteraceae bacterium]|nr:metalloregulator ArsR/SmtB family transcription factor [Caulobacteraceae bacterium]
MDSPADEAGVLEFFKALANDSRLRMVGLLAERERTGGELARALGISEPTVSHHLAMLARLGLISTRAEGTTRRHRLDTARLEAFRAARLGALAPRASAPRWPPSSRAAAPRGGGSRS